MTEAIVIHVGPPYLLARTASEKILVHSEDADFVIAEAQPGDVIGIERFEATSRLLRGRGVTFIRRPCADVTDVESPANFDGIVTHVNIERGFAFARAFQLDGDVFLHVREFADYHEGRSAAFMSLTRGARVNGVCYPTDRGTYRGFEIELS